MARVLSAVVVAAMVVTAAAQLQGVSAQSPCKVHTWHNVTAMKGTWAATITSIHEDATFVYPLDGSKTECMPFESPRGHFNITQVRYEEFGFLPGPTADFSSMYALTLLRTDKTMEARGGDKVGVPDGQMACVFVIGAAGPAMPDVRVEPYNNAQCRWTVVPGVGENYFVDFNDDE